MTDRLRCSCFDCNRTIAHVDDGCQWLWICAKHWPLVPKHLKRRLALCRRREKKDPRWSEVRHQVFLRCIKAAEQEALMGVPV